MAGTRKVRALWLAAAVALLASITPWWMACAAAPATQTGSPPPPQTIAPVASSNAPVPSASASAATPPRRPSPFRAELLALEKASGQSARADWAYPAGVHELEGYRPVAWRGGVLAMGHGRAVSLLNPSDLSERLRLSGHDGQITALAISHDGKLLASGAKDATIRLWDAATGAELRQITGHRALVAELAFSPRGDTLASLDDWDGEVLRLWEVDSGREIRNTSDADGYNGVGFSSDGARLAACASKPEIRFWKVSSGGWAGRPLPVGDRLLDQMSRCRFAPNLSTVACAGVRGRFPSHSYYLRLYEMATGIGIVEIDTMSILPPMDFSPDGSLLATASFGTPELWNVKTGTRERELERADNHIGEFAFGPGGKALAGTSQYGSVVLWDANDGKVIERIAPHRPPIAAVAFSPDGKTLAVSNRHYGAQLWALDAPMGVRDLRVPGDRGLGPLAFSPDGATLAAGRSAGVQLSERSTMRIARTLSAGLNWVSALAYFPDGRRIVAGGIDGYLAILDTTTGKQVTELPHRQYDVAAIALSPDGSLLAVGSNQQAPIHLLDTASGKQLRKLEVPKHFGNALAFSSDGNILVSGSRDGTARLWDSATGRKRRMLKGKVGEIYSVALSADDQIIAAGGDWGLVQLWNAATGRAIRRLEGHEAPVLALAFSADGRLLASGSADGSTWLWDAASGAPLLSLHPVLGSEGSFALSPDGKVELFGFPETASPQALVCRVGLRIFPFEACRDRVQVTGLLPRALARQNRVTAENDE